MTERHEICPVEELPPGERTIVEVAGRSIGVFNVDGEFYALKNTCPHQLAPLCEGEVTGIVTSDRVGEYEWERDGEILRCPWHHWAFDIATGESTFNPHEVRTASYDVAVETATTAEDRRQVEEYGTSLAGDEPPVETYEVDVESEVVVLYV